MGIDSALLRQVEQRLSGLPLRVRLWDGHQLDLVVDPSVTVTLTGPKALRHMLRPTLETLGAAYIEGEIEIDGSIWDVVQLAEALAEATPKGITRWRPRKRSKREDAEAVSYHYDVSNDFYALFLDRRMVYSCAYFKTGSEDIHQAQEQKLEHICRKLMLKPGERFLDIGCGWGALMLWAAEHHGVDATGVTLSRQQFEFAQARIREAGLESRCRVLLCDYRDLPREAAYDKIASVGMFEHVGLKNLPGYFGAARDLLKENGLMLNHGITVPEGAQAAKGLDPGSFIERYVFPLGELPSLGLVIHEMARQDLEVLDVESLRPHYAQTLAHWVTRLEANSEAARATAGDQRYRIWRAYMAACVRNFERGGVSIYQVLAGRQRDPGPAAVPWTREHLYAQGVAAPLARPNIPPRTP